MSRIFDLLHLRTVDTEHTADPFWYVAQNSPNGRVILAGIWFNRKDAEAFLERRRYRFPKGAYVYCDSANSESHLAEVYALDSKVCQHCGLKIPNPRPNKTYCSDACKHRAKRLRSKQHENE